MALLHWTVRSSTVCALAEKQRKEDWVQWIITHTKAKKMNELFVGKELKVALVVCFCACLTWCPGRALLQQGHRARALTRRRCGRT
jgi:hypothetical protein